MSPTSSDLSSYRPLVQSRKWILSSTDVDFISTGTFVLGCGGGGEPATECVKIQQLLRQSPGSVQVVEMESVRDTAMVGVSGNMGRPEVSADPGEDKEPLLAQGNLTRFMGLVKVDAMIAVEIGGANGLMNFRVAADLSVPVVDGDYMGRAYPTCCQMTMNVDDQSKKGENLLPMAVVMGDGTSMIITASKTDKLIDSILRALYLEVGTARAGLAIRPQIGRSIKRQAVPNTISLAWRIARAVHLASSLSSIPDIIIEEAGGPQSAKKLFEGTIVDVKREWRGGHMYGTAEIHGSNGPNGEICIIPFKNENIAVQLKTNDGDAEPRTLSSVPDLIAVLDARSGRGIGAMFEYSPGMKVFVIAIAASPRWTESPRGLELGGPAAMGYEDIDYIPVGKYNKPRSVIEEFNVQI